RFENIVPERTSEIPASSEPAADRETEAPSAEREKAPRKTTRRTTRTAKAAKEPDGAAEAVPEPAAPRMPDPTETASARDAKRGRGRGRRGPKGKEAAPKVPYDIEEDEESLALAESSEEPQIIVNLTELKRLK